jgi:hypothetical protein
VQIGAHVGDIVGLGLVAVFFIILQAVGDESSQAFFGFCRSAFEKR